MLQDGSAVIYDRNVTSELRVINAATDTVPRDVAINSVFSPPLFSAAPFAEPTAYAPVALGAQTLNVTPVGNPGVLELETQIAPTPAQRMTLMFTGPAGALLYAVIADDGRRIQGEAKAELHERGDAIPCRRLRAHSDGGRPDEHSRGNGARSARHAVRLQLLPSRHLRPLPPRNHDRRIALGTDGYHGRRRRHLRRARRPMAPTRRRPPSRCTTTSPETRTRVGTDRCRATCYPSPAATLHVPR